MTPGEFEAEKQTALMLRADGWPNEAAAVLHGLIKKHPDDPWLWNEFGAALTDLRLYQEGQSAYRTALELAPDYADAHSNIGNGLMLLFDFEGAEKALRRALALDPSHAVAWANLGDALLAQRRVKESLAAYEQAVRLAPAHPAIRLHYAHALLLTGDLERGFLDYEWRWKGRNAPSGPGASPLQAWSGGFLNGKTIRVYAEQGHGDAIMFIRYAPMVKDLGGNLVLLARPPLLRLMSGAPGVAAVEAIDERARLSPGQECDIGLMSLPRILGTRLETIPAPIPYLFADPDAADRWRARLAPLSGVRVGLVWAGEPRPEQPENNLIDSWRSMPLAALAPLARIPGVSFVSLQMGEAARQPRPEGLALFDPMDEMKDFADTAALIEALDLVISVDTSVAHLAGALGKEVWIFSRFDGCWRWFLDRDDTPWYPKARLFRQTRRMDWRDPVAKAAEALAQYANNHKEI